MDIIGQTKVLSQIDTYYTTQHLPKTLMFLGPSGCGKGTLAKYVAEKFNLDFVKIEESVSAQDLEDYLHSTIDTLYLINLSNFTEKQQNIFLKFIEEPSKSVYVVLIANSEAGVLSTILNRCIKLQFEPYSKEEIELIINQPVNELAFKIFQTPGKLLNLTDSALADLIRVGTEVVSQMSLKSYGQAMSISTKINYKDLYSKIDFSLFFDVVAYLALEDFKTTGNMKSFDTFIITNKFKQYVSHPGLIKEALMLNYLTTLWEAVRV